jgi:translation initiation factor IF-2
MLKARIYELAKQLNMKSTDIVKKLTELGVGGKNHMSVLEEGELDIFFEGITQQTDMNEKTPEELVPAPVSENEKKAPLPREAKPKEEKKAVVTNKKDISTQAPQTVITEEKQVTAAEETKIVEPAKKVRYVDTRQSVVDINKLENEQRIETTLVPDHLGNAKNDKFVNKQKIKKGSAKQKDKASDTKSNKPQPKPAKPKQKIKILVPDEITVGELAQKISKPSVEIIKSLMQLGIMANINQVIDFDTASLIAEDIGVEIEKEVIITQEEKLLNDVEDKEEDLEPRSPVVVVMGHVDHGKTSLLDAIRSTNVIATEAGGITQHIGAHRVNIHDKKITFLDTPGHEAFTSMRARGASITDIAILVVSADDGIMPQTIEAINHAKAAKVGIIVAINKIDKPGANPDQVKQQLTEYGLIPEEWGGDTICVEVSAKKKINIDGLLEMVILLAEMRDLKANPNRAAKGTVIEARLDKGKGPVATLLVQNGTLKAGDVVIAGTAVGKIRAMTNDRGKVIKKAGPSVPVEILGLSEVPEGGDIFYAVADEKTARSVAETRKQKQKEEIFNAHKKVTLENLFDDINDGSVKELNIVVKADVQGSLEAVKQSLSKLSCEEVRVHTIHGGVGAINESDVMLADASNAIIVGFNVTPDAGARSSAQARSVDVRLYRVIYQAIEEIEAAIKGMLKPEFKEEVTGHAEIRQTFKVSGVGTIAGCYITDGTVKRSSKIRVIRDGIIIHEGELASLKRFKDDVKEAREGYECGMNLEKFNDIKEGDTLEAFEMKEVAR